MTVPFLQSARARLLLLVLLVVIPAFVVQGYGAWSDLQREIANRKQDAGQMVVRAQGKFETLLDTSRSVFSELVRLNEMRTPNNCTLIFNDLRLAYERLAPDATNIGLSDAQGNIYCAVNPVLGDKNIISRPDFVRAAQTLDMAIGAYALNPATGLPTLGVAYPVLSFDGKVQTVIFITYELRWLESWQKEVALPAGTVLTLVTPDGNFLQRYMNNTIISIEGDAGKTQWYAPLQNGQAGLEAPDLDGVTRLHTLAPLRLGLENAAWLHLGYPVAEIYTQAQQALAWRLTILCAIFVAALGLAWWGSEALFLRPLTSLMRVVERVQHGDLSARAAFIPAVGELTGLAQSFDRMAESLQQRESAQRQAQNELQESEARFRSMFESSAMGVVILDLKTLTLRYNPMALGLLDDAELPAALNDPYEFINAQYRDAEHVPFTELLNGQRDSYTTDHCYQRLGEEDTWSHVTVSAVKDSQGAMRYIVAMLENITQQKKDQQKLRESETRFRAMFENTSVGMGLLGLDRRIIDANPAMSIMLGLTHDELLGETPVMVTHPDDLDESARLFQDLVSGKIDHYDVERRYLRKGGQSFWASVSMSMVRAANGTPLYLVGLINDIDQQKRAAESLRESEARFRAMYDNAAVGMAMMSLDRKIISINQTAANMTGFTLEELYNTDPSRLSYPEDVPIGMEQFHEMVVGKIPGFQMEKRFVRKNGETFWGRVTYSAVPGKDGQPEYLVGIIEDVTEQRLTGQKLAEQEAEYRRTLEQRVDERTHELADANLRLLEEIEQRKRVEEALAAKAAEDAVAAERTRLARDLHDAVTQTLFASSLIAEVLPDLWAMDVDEAIKSTEELRQLTRGALAEMRTLLLELRPAALTQSKLGDLIRQLCEALIGRARLPINFVAEGDRSMPPEAQVAFYRIAQESLNNVFKYARATKVDVELFLTPAGAHFSVCDNGVGFDMSTKKTTSLGLRIMRERAEAVGAQLSIDSTPGKGTCVEVEWIEKPDMKLSVFKK